VIARVPYIGNFVLFVNSLGNFYYFIIIIIIIVNILLSLFFDTDEKKKSANEEPHEKRKLFGKLEIGKFLFIIKIILFIVLNVLLIGFAIFNQWGTYTFWQPGADIPPPKHVTIRGMYSDLQYHASFKSRYTYVNLSQGFFTYAIDCFVSDGLHNGLRPGVPTFSWLQFSVFVLIIFDAWTLINYFIKSGKLLKRETAT
jgi:hypothetical protein